MVKKQKIRKANEITYILRLMYLYGCFHREDISRILAVNDATLNKQYGILADVFEDGRYSVPDKRIDGREMDEEALLEEASDLWRLYSSHQETVKMQERRDMYWAIVKILGKKKESFKKISIEYPDYRLEGVDASGKSYEKALKAALEELIEMDIVAKDRNGSGAKYYLRDEFSKHLKVEKSWEKQLAQAIHYALHIFYPALSGYQLGKRLEDWMQDDIIHARFNFQGYQPQTILDEKSFMDLDVFVKKQIPICFFYVDNNRSRLDVGQKAFKQERTVIPYKLLHERRYGRSFLVGYCLENHRMRGYRVDFMQGIKKTVLKSEEKLNTEQIEEMYQKTFKDSWIGGRVEEDGNSEHKVVRLEILNPQKDSRVVKRFGMTAKRDGHIVRENEKTYYEICVANTKDIKPWIMSLGDRVKVVSVKEAGSGNDKTADQKELWWNVADTWKEMRANYDRV